MHKYKCANCGLVFLSSKITEKCPECGSKVLIHIEGEPKKRSCSCENGNCSSCGGQCG